MGRLKVAQSKYFAGKSHTSDVPESTKRNVIRGILSTGDVAFFCRVATRTVCKWCDNNVIPHIRIPGSLDRRIYLNDFLVFAKRAGYRLHTLVQNRVGLWSNSYTIPKHVLDMFIGHAYEEMTLVDMASRLRSDAPYCLVLGTYVPSTERIGILNIVKDNYVEVYPQLIINILSDETSLVAISEIQQKFPDFIFSKESEFDWTKLQTSYILKEVI